MMNGENLSLDIDDATGQYFVADGGVRSRRGAPLGTAATTKRRRRGVVDLFRMCLVGEKV